MLVGMCYYVFCYHNLNTTYFTKSRYSSLDHYLIHVVKSTGKANISSVVRGTHTITKTETFLNVNSTIFFWQAM